MSAQVRRGARCGAFVLIGACLTACGSFNGASTRVANLVTPYKIDVVQGNFVSREQVEALKPGMSRQQVKEVLGTPLLTSLFHGDRWEYVFTMKRPGVEVQSRKLTVFFQGDAFERAVGDDMPTEAEFVATLGTRVKKKDIPPLEATDAQLARFPAPAQPSAPVTDVTSTPSLTAYPPLESSAR